MRIIVIIVVILGLVGVVGYLIVSRNAQQTQTVDNTAISPTSTSTTTGGVPSDAKVTAPVTASREILMTASEFKFTPSEIRVKKGETVKITMTNSGKMPHDWIVEKMGGASIDTIPGGSTNSITITPSQTGTFTTFCSVGNHRQQGMVGTLIVE